MYNEELVRFGCKKILKLIEISFYSSAKIWKCGKMESYSGFCICLLSFWKYKNKYTCVFPKLNSQQLYVSQYVKVSDYVPFPSVDNFPSIEVSTDYNSSIVRGGLIWEDLGVHQILTESSPDHKLHFSQPDGPAPNSYSSIYKDSSTFLRYTVYI